MRLSCLCWECKRNDSFIEKAQKVHGCFYDYSQVNYVDNRTKVVIICPHHGAFEQSPNKHLSGCGCRKCAVEKRQRTMLKNYVVFWDNNLSDFDSWVESGMPIRYDWK